MSVMEQTKLELKKILLNILDGSTFTYTSHSDCSALVRRSFCYSIQNFIESLIKSGATHQEF